MNDLLKGLALDKWYKLVVYLGTMLFILGLIHETKALANRQVLLLAVSLISFGLAEWRCDTFIQFYKPPNVYTGPAAMITKPLRRATLGSVLLHLAAAGFFAWFASTLLS